jgi:hypothetical protein
MVHWLQGLAKVLHSYVWPCGKFFRCLFLFSRDKRGVEKKNVATSISGVAATYFLVFPTLPTILILHEKSDEFPRNTVVLHRMLGHCTAARAVCTVSPVFVIR